MLINDTKMYFSCWPETMFWRQRKMNFKKFQSYPMLLGTGLGEDWGVFFIKIFKVTSARPSLLFTQRGNNQRLLLGEKTISKTVRPRCTTAVSVIMIHKMWIEYMFVFLAPPLCLDAPHTGGF